MANDLDQPTYYSNSSDSDNRFSRDSERERVYIPRYAKVVTIIGHDRCNTDHEQLKNDPELWAELVFVGEQQTWDDDGNPAVLILRNCGCGSTLAKLKTEAK